MAKRRAEEDAEGTFGLAEDPRPGAGGGGQATRDEAIAAGAPRLPHASMRSLPTPCRARSHVLTTASARAHPLALATASAAVRGLALKSQQDALASIQQPTVDLDRLLAWGLGADPAAVFVCARARARAMTSLTPICLLSRPYAAMRGACVRHPTGSTWLPHMNCCTVRAGAGGRGAAFFGGDARAEDAARSATRSCQERLRSLHADAPMAKLVRQRGI